MSSKLGRAILVFAKDAEPGTVKTRLRPLLDDAQCVSLHLAFLQDTLEKTRRVPAADVYLFVAGLRNLPSSLMGVSIRMQEGSDLGERMRRAFEEMLQQYKQVIIVGTDCPAMDTQCMSVAFSMLDSHDLVIGPSEDGGYYLIGLSRRAPDIFHEISWGTPAVLDQTLKAAAQYKYALLVPLFDIDHPEDLIRLQKELPRMPQQEMPCTIAWLRDWKAQL